METPVTTLAAVGAWYAIGVAAGLGAAIGLLLAAIVAPRRRVALLALAVVAGIAAAGIGYLLDDWGAVSGAVGAVLGSVVAAQLVVGTLGRGGTRTGTAVILGGTALGVALLALIPAVGYVETAALPVLAARLRRTGRDTYAGLRILARD